MGLSPAVCPVRSKRCGKHGKCSEKVDKGFLVVKDPRIGTGKFKNQIVIRSADLKNVMEISQEAFANCGKSPGSTVFGM